MVKELHSLLSLQDHEKSSTHISPLLPYTPARPCHSTTRLFRDPANVRPSPHPNNGSSNTAIRQDSAAKQQIAGPGRTPETFFSVSPHKTNGIDVGE